MCKITEKINVTAINQIKDYVEERFKQEGLLDRIQFKITNAKYYPVLTVKIKSANNNEFNEFEIVVSFLGASQIYFGAFHPDANKYIEATYPLTYYYLDKTIKRFVRLIQEGKI